MTAHVITRGTIVGLAGIVCVGSCWANQELMLDWADQFCTTQNDIGYGVALDSLGNIVVAGATDGPLAGAHQGSSDAFVRKYDASGAHLWTRQLGSPYFDAASDLVTDPFGNIFVAGNTRGLFPGATGSSSERNPPDGFLTKFNAAGQQLWARQLGTFSNSDNINSVATDVLGNAYIAGTTRSVLGTIGPSSIGNRDAYLAKYDPAGNQLWVVQFGTSGNDSGASTAVDADGNIFITGRVRCASSLPSTNEDAYIRKYSPNGSLLWSEQLDLSYSDLPLALALDDQGNPTIAGRLENTNESFLAKYGGNGGLLWTEVMVGSPLRYLNSIDIDPGGNITATGHSGQWGEDIVLARYDPDGNLIENELLISWDSQYNYSPNDWNNAVVVDDTGAAFITGWTEGSFTQNQFGARDVYLVKYVVPEPGSIALLAMGGLLAARRRRG